MELALNNGFSELSHSEMEHVDGGLLGVAWLTGLVVLKVFGAGVTLGSAAAGIYYATK